MSGAEDGRRLQGERVLVYPSAMQHTAHTDGLEFRGSGIHGMGAYARVAVREGTRLIEYLGERIDKAESLRRCIAENPYIFHLDDTWDLDGSVDWNPARFINHSCDPNCEAEEDEGRIWIVALRRIEAGEEITFNYGYDLAEYQDHPCLCGSSLCVGFMVAKEFFPEIRSRRAASEVP